MVPTRFSGGRPLAGRQRGELAGVRFSDFVRNFPRFVFVQQIDALRVFSQKLEANGVERADGHGADRTFAAELLFQAFAHFHGGLVREGYSGDFRRLDAAVLDEIGDARDECLGFSRAWPSDHRYRAFRRGYSGKLFLVQAVEGTGRSGGRGYGWGGFRLCGALLELSSRSFLRGRLSKEETDLPV